MALGYTIAAILKRNSHVFSDERVCVKIDWLEQVNRHYVQVLIIIFISLLLRQRQITTLYICCAVKLSFR